MTHEPYQLLWRFSALLADHLNEVALGEQAAQSVFCNHIRGFFYHGLPLGPCSAWVQYQAHGVATPLSDTNS